MEEHIKSLMDHGAKVKVGEGLIPLTLGFYREAMQECRRKGCKVREFGLVLPDLEEFKFLLAIWVDGHVDSGCEDSVRFCVARRIG